MPENDTHPHAPEGADRIGAPPSAPNGGEGGERGSSVFTGNADWNADGSPAGDDAAAGPNTGDSYHAAQNPQSLGTHSEGARESATRESSDD